MSNVVPNAPNQNLHDKALKLLTEMQANAPEKKAKGVVSDYNKRRKAATASLKPVLTDIEACFKRGESVGGQYTIKDWCGKIGYITYRRFHQITTSESQTKKTKKTEEVKSLHLLPTVQGVPQLSGVYHLHSESLRRGLTDVPYTMCGIAVPLPVTDDKKVFECRGYSMGRVKNQTLCLHCRRVELEEAIAEFAVECADASKVSAPAVAPVVKTPAPTKKKAKITITVTPHHHEVVKDAQPPDERDTWTEADSEKWLKRRAAADKAKATRLANAPQTEHFTAQSKGFGRFIVINKATGYQVRNGELQYCDNKEAQAHLEGMEQDIIRKAQQEEDYYEDDKIEVEMLRQQLVEGMVEGNAINDEERVEMTEDIVRLEESIAEYEKDHGAASALALVAAGE